MENDCLLFANPMTVDVRIVHLNLQFEVIEMQSDVVVKTTTDQQFSSQKCRALTRLERVICYCDGGEDKKFNNTCKHKQSLKSVLE
ncbi:hypothetical protein ANN_15212 [Periplaneta americana]|uniref:SWIM-type domain-containing protein n=1 Tax=Periplaneta americana TaxID=6978 RepID=A0ABQ8SFT8_PERAM|nr:hypothetical protein ANN_15212 [Periplaneta americana]